MNLKKAGSAGARYSDCAYLVISCDQRLVVTSPIPRKILLVQNEMTRIMDALATRIRPTGGREGGRGEGGEGGAEGEGGKGEGGEGGEGRVGREGGEGEGGKGQ